MGLGSDDPRRPITSQQNHLIGFILQEKEMKVNNLER
jgi:hypothetical protein